MSGNVQGGKSTAPSESHGPTNTGRTYEYDVALSFAGEDRDRAEDIACALEAHGVTVFYDAFEKAELWGKDLPTFLADVYSNRARYCIMLLSQHYASKAYPTHERKAALARALSQQQEYVLPVRLDDTEVPGILSTVGRLDAGEESVGEIVECVLQKLGSRDASRTPRLAALYDSSLEPTPFASWTLFSTAGVSDQSVSFGSRRADGSPTCRIATTGREPVGVCKSFPSLRGRIEFEYQVEFSRSAGLNVFLYAIPMQETGIRRSGLIEVGADVQDDSRNALSPYRRRLVVPQAHYGDEKWHSAVLGFDFRETPTAFYTIFGPRVNEGSVHPAGGALLVSRVRLLAVRS